MRKPDGIDTYGKECIIHYTFCHYLSSRINNAQYRRHRSYEPKHGMHRLLKHISRHQICDDYPQLQAPGVPLTLACQAMSQYFQTSSATDQQPGVF